MACNHDAMSSKRRAMAALKVVPQCCLYSRSVHQHLGHGPLSCRQRRLQACFGRCMRARGLSCGMQSRCDVVTSQGLRRRVACVGSLESGAAVLSVSTVEVYISTLAMDHGAVDYQLMPLECPHTFTSPKAVLQALRRGLSSS